MKRALILGLALAFGTTSAFAASFDTLDSDSNGELSRDEFYGGVADLGVYSDWDTSGDGLLDESEFDAIGQDWDYDTWDVDDNSYIDASEFYDGYYVTYDTTEDGHWDGVEWDDAGEDGLFDW